MGTGGNEISEMPNDQYACTKCNAVPEIKSINYEQNIIKIKCPKHGVQKLNIKDYSEKQKEYVYYSVKCKDTKLEQRNFITSKRKQYFSHCFNCKKDLCLECVNRHSCTSLIKVNEINDICRYHLLKYNKYCFTCNKNCCEKCHCQHNNIKIIEKASDEDIKKIEEKKAQIKQNIENQKLFIKFLDTIKETYKTHPSNYYHTINIHNVVNNEINQSKIIIDQLDKLEKKVLDYLNFKLNIKINGKEKILQLDHKNLGTVELELLTGIKFENLEELYLNNNNIDNIDSLKDLYSPKLKKIDLSYNNIHNIDSLKENILKPPKLFRNIMEIKLDFNKDILEKDIEDIRRLIKGDNNKECNLEYELVENMKEIRIVGHDFFNNHKDSCKMQIEEKEEENLKEYYQYEYKESKNKTIKITLIVDENIGDITGIFNQCENLISINRIFNINQDKIIDLSDLFSGCLSLRNLPNSLSEWDTSNVTNMNSIFYLCRSLKNLPDISSWKTSNVTSMLSMFNGCSSLSELPDISKWDISSTENISCMFFNCSSLREIPNISNWETEKVANMRDMFNGCSKIKDLSFLTNWKTSNVTNMRNMFKGCTSLSSKPDISKWDMKNVKDKNDMFKNCP